MKETLKDILEIMIQDYDICFEEEMTPTEYKKIILKGIDKHFEKEYNNYKEEESEE